jgi:DNA-binding transcriptional LysR family regulator
VFDELRAFATAAELGSLGRAALMLGVTQPALSKRLAALESRAGTPLLKRSARGVTLTPAGRRLYEEARRLLQQAGRTEQVIAELHRSSGPVRLASSHSAAEALVADLLGDLGDTPGLRVELVIGNSGVVRDLVADGRVDLGVAASQRRRAPGAGVRQLPLAEDAIVCAVPTTHAWARRASVSQDQFLGTAMVVRDRSSNARLTVATILQKRGLQAAPPLAEAGTSQAAMREARARNAPLLLSRRVLAGHGFHEVAVDGLAFPREFVIVLPAHGEPAGEVVVLIEKLRHHAVGTSDQLGRSSAAA